MPFTLTMPKLSPTMEEGMIAKWHKKEGDHVEAGELLLEVATDKATVEYSAIDEGWLRKIIVKEGGNVGVNQAVAIFSADQNEDISQYKPEGESPKAAAPQTAKTEKGAPSEPKAQTPAPTQAPTAPVFVPEPPLESSFAFPTRSPESRIPASPLARKLAKEQGLDLSTVKGSGPNERIMSRDLSLAQKSGTVTFGHREMPSIPPGTYEEETLTPMRKTIARRLQEAKAWIPHFYVSLDVNAVPLHLMREQLRAGEIKITYNDAIIKACAIALKEHPNVNSGFHSVNNTIIRFKTIDIGVAVSLPSGLITPIIRHADFKNIGEISIEMHALAKRAKEGKLQENEYKGGSFTISNLGMYGVSNFQAIINPPQAAILSISGIRDIPVVQHGQIVPGKLLTLTISADHRVIDGVAAAQFLNTVQKYLENPSLLLLS